MARTSRRCFRRSNRPRRSRRASRTTAGWRPVAHEVHQGGVDHHRFAGDVRAVPGPHEQDPRVGVLECLGRLATAAADARWFERDRAALEALARKTTEMVLASVDVGSSPADDASANAVMGARELANVAHGLAKCGAARASDEPETFLRERRLRRRHDVERLLANETPSPNERIYPFENTRSAGWREGCRRKRKRFVRPDARFDRRAGER